MVDCPFCKVVAGDVPSWKVYEDDHTCAFFDINPMSAYHTLVVPKVHYTDVFDMPEQELLWVMQAVKRVVNIYEQQLGIRNLHIVNNNGALAQQDVFHAHFHLIPRSAGDGQDRWRTTYPNLRAQFDELIAQLEL